MAGALQVDVGTVSVGQVLDRRDGVILADVDRHVGTAGQRQLQLRPAPCPARRSWPGTWPAPRRSCRARSARSRPPRPRRRRSDSPRSTACSAQDSGSTNAAWAGGRSALILCTRASRRKDHVTRHRPGRAVLEAVDVVRGAHVVLAAHAVAACPARHDLLAGHAVADRDPPPRCGRLVELDHSADELVARGSPRSRPRPAGSRRPRTSPRRGSTSGRWRRCRQPRPGPAPRPARARAPAPPPAGSPPGRDRSRPACCRERLRSPSSSACLQREVASPSHLVVRREPVIGDPARAGGSERTTGTRVAAWA